MVEEKETSPLKELGCGSLSDLGNSLVSTAGKLTALNYPNLSIYSSSTEPHNNSLLLVATTSYNVKKHCHALDRSYRKRTLRSTNWGNIWAAQV